MNVQNEQLVNRIPTVEEQGDKILVWAWGDAPELVKSLVKLKQQEGALPDSVGPQWVLLFPAGHKDPPDVGIGMSHDVGYELNDCLRKPVDPKWNWVSKYAFVVQNDSAFSVHRLADREWSRRMDVRRGRCVYDLPLPEHTLRVDEFDPDRVVIMGATNTHSGD